MEKNEYQLVTERLVLHPWREWEADQVRILPVATRYLDRGEMFVMRNREDKPVAIAVVTDEGDGILELKNLAVGPSFQRKGYGRRMIEYLCGHYRHRFHTMLAGTGDSMKTLSFYRNCGFSYSHTVADFFIKNYDHPIIEDGKMLKDMIYFKRDIRPS